MVGSFVAGSPRSHVGDLLYLRIEDRAFEPDPFLGEQKFVEMLGGENQEIMNESEGMLWVVVGSVVVMTLALWLIIAARKSARTGAMYQVQRQFHNVKIIASSDRAEFRGLDRSWDGQWRGQGVLLLTDDCLHFRLTDREMDLSVPVSRIERVEVASEGERSTLRRRQLRVAYRAFDDQLRTATWSLKGARKWKDLIMAAAGRKG